MFNVVRITYLHKHLFLHNNSYINGYGCTEFSLFIDIVYIEGNRKHLMHFGNKI